VVNLKKVFIPKIWVYSEIRLLDSWNLRISGSEIFIFKIFAFGAVRLISNGGFSGIKIIYEWIWGINRGIEGIYD